MIRIAKLNDLPAISRLIAELDYVPPAGLEDKLRRLTADPAEALLVFEHLAEVVAFLSLHFIPQIALAGDFARISYFAVSGAVRNTGIGREMEAYITALALARNCDRIEVHCHTRRADAHRFYERQGYDESPKYFIKSLHTPEL